MKDVHRYRELRKLVDVAVGHVQEIDWRHDYQYLFLNDSTHNYVTDHMRVCMWLTCPRRSRFNSKSSAWSESVAISRIHTRAAEFLKNEMLSRLSQKWF